MGTKKSVIVLCGGKSTEHQISIKSAMNVISGLDQKKYVVSLVYITLQGAWYFIEDALMCLKSGPAALLKEGEFDPVTVRLGADKPTLISLLYNKKSYVADCILPMLHGSNGEDGCTQGLLQLIDAAYAGSDALSSAICMDKDITKQLLNANGIKVAPWFVLTADSPTNNLYEKLSEKFGRVLFVKPNSQGSSVGVSRIESSAEFLKAVKEAFRFDDRVIVEPCIYGREIECAVLGDSDPVASLPSEIITHHSFYSYEAKYLDPNGATTTVPANLPENITKKIREISIAAFKVLRCSGMLRVDFFVSENDIFINEVNTIPGFTDISLYPQMCKASGIEYSDLLDQIINIAIKRQKNKNNLEHMYSELESATKLNQMNLDGSI